jgi:hypothetical protein
MHLIVRVNGHLGTLVYPSGMPTRWAQSVHSPCKAQQAQTEQVCLGLGQATSSLKVEVAEKGLSCSQRKMDSFAARNSEYGTRVGSEGCGESESGGERGGKSASKASS